MCSVTIGIHYQRNHSKKIIRKKIKTLITETHISGVRNSTLVTTKLNVVVVVPKDTKEMNVDEVKTEHVVDAIKLDIMKECVDPKKNITSNMPSTVPLLSCEIQMQTLILTMSIYMLLKIETSTSSKLQSFTISINKNKVNMLTDSVSTLNIIDKSTYNQLHEAELLTPTYIKVYPYQTSNPLELEGKFNCSVTANGSTIPTTFDVIKSTGKCILGMNTSELLNLLRVGPPTKQEVLQTKASTKLNPSTQQIINKYQDIFKGMGTLKNFKLQLHINQNITPVQQPIRRSPYHTKQKVLDEL